MIDRFLYSIYHPECWELKHLRGVLSSPRINYSVIAYIRDTDGRITRAKAFAELRYGITWIQMKTILRQHSLDRVHTQRTSFDKIDGAQYICALSELIIESPDAPASLSYDHSVDQSEM
jgi:hypothetical protein